MTNMRFRRALMWAGCIVLILPFIFSGCGDEGEVIEPVDLTQPDITNPPGTQPPVNGDLPNEQPDVGEQPDDPPDGGEEPPVEEPPVEEPPVEEPPVEEPKISFQNEVMPILQASCAFPGCHGPNPPSGLLLTTFDDFAKGGFGGDAFTPNDSAGSLIIKRITGAQQPQMPLGGAPLKPEEIDLIEAWIDEGGLDN